MDYRATHHAGTCPSVGYALQGGHFGEILQGEATARDGSRVRALCTLPQTRWRSCAVLVTDDTRELRVDPPEAKKALGAALAAFELCGVTPPGGTLSITSSIPIGAGMGSSSADMAAAVQAVARALDASITWTQTAWILRNIEGAVDPIMIARPVLYAQRRAQVLRSYERFPDMTVVGLDTAPLADGGIDTAAFTAPEYALTEQALHAQLVRRLDEALREGDVRKLGQVATASALVNQRYLPKPRMDELLAIKTATEAAGLIVAHTGTVAGFIYEPHALGEAKRAYVDGRITEMGFRAMGLVR